MDKSGSKLRSKDLDDNNCTVRISRDSVSVQCTGDILIRKLSMFQKTGQFCNFAILVPKNCSREEAKIKKQTEKDNVKRPEETGKDDEKIDKVDKNEKSENSVQECNNETKANTNEHNEDENLKVIADGNEKWGNSDKYYEEKTKASMTKGSHNGTKNARSSCKNRVKSKAETSEITVQNKDNDNVGKKKVNLESNEINMKSKGLKSIKKLASYKQIFAHTCVISAGSELFYSILSDPIMKHNTNKQIIIDSISGEHVQQCISYLYGEKIVFDKKDINEFMTAAKKLKIKTLENQCKLAMMFLNENAGSVDLESSNSDIVEIKGESKPVHGRVLGTVSNKKGDNRSSMNSVVAHFEVENEKMDVQILTSSAVEKHLNPPKHKKSSSKKRSLNKQAEDEPLSKIKVQKRDRQSSGQKSENNPKDTTNNTQTENKLKTKRKVGKKDIKAKKGTKARESVVESEQTILSSGNHQVIQLSTPVSTGTVAGTSVIHQNPRTTPSAKKLSNTDVIKRENRMLNIKGTLPSTSVVNEKNQESQNVKTELGEINASERIRKLTNEKNIVEYIDRIIAKNNREIMSDEDAGANSPFDVNGDDEDDEDDDARDDIWECAVDKISEDNDTKKSKRKEILARKAGSEPQAGNADINKKTLNQALANSITGVQSQAGSNVEPDSQYYLTLPTNSIAVDQVGSDSNGFTFQFYVPMPGLPGVQPQIPLMLLPQTDVGNGGSESVHDVKSVEKKNKKNNSAEKENKNTSSTSHVKKENNVKKKSGDDKKPSLYYKFFETKKTGRWYKTKDAYPSDFPRKKKTKHVVLPEDNAGKALFHHSYAFASVERQSRDIVTAHTNMGRKKFANEAERREFHRYKNSLPRKCDHCNEIFRTSTAYHIHMRKVRAKFKQCQYCDFKTTQSGSLRLHEKRHRQEKPYECNFCNFRACTKVEVGFHRVIHTREKLFICEVCGKDFLRPNSLRMHRLREHGVGNRKKGTPICFECEFCDFRHPSISALQAHQISHSDERAHLCSVCGRRYKTAPHLRRHRREVHKIIDPKIKRSLATTTNVTIDEDWNLTERAVTKKSDDSDSGLEETEGLDIKKEKCSKTEIDQPKVEKTYVPLNTNFKKNDTCSDENEIVQDYVEVSTARTESDLNVQICYEEAIIYNETINNNIGVMGEDSTEISVHADCTRSKSLHETETKQVQESGISISFVDEIDEGRTNDDKTTISNTANESSFERLYFNQQFGNQTQGELSEVRGISLDPNDQTIIESLEQIEAMEAAEHLEIVNSYSML